MLNINRKNCYITQKINARRKMQEKCLIVMP